MLKSRVIRKLDHQLCTAEFSEGPIIEFLEDRDVAFAMVHIDEDNVRHLTIFNTPEHLQMDFDAFVEIVEIAKRNVQIMT